MPISTTDMEEQSREHVIGLDARIRTEKTGGRRELSIVRTIFCT